MGSLSVKNAREKLSRLGIFKWTKIKKSGYCLFIGPTWMSGGQERAGRCSWSPWMSEAQGWPRRGRRPGWRRARCVSRPGARSATGSCTGPPAQPNMKASIYFMYPRRFLCTFHTLLISKLLCTKSEGGGRESSPPLPVPPSPGTKWIHFVPVALKMDLLPIKIITSRAI